ncbi:Tetrathionate reductase subunit A [Granulosicoccus antarcticus IMCC3135]|uniref:Tetrathionate reductase subunit A n=2 Tax=Granulosicoccus TaxID=437504 RepID=A0A2Z2NIM2_9GAMM|nr:Tetrathionate reductase subunit A [Granulosicoccus antarcticus IMCC3135]
MEGEEIRFIQGNPKHPVNKGVLCAKGNAGIMKQKSPAKLTQPLVRKAGTERGDGEFEPISWDKALTLLTERLRKIRAHDPKRLAFFTGRDQMQALTGFWASQFGTINWAAHGGFCSVNMAAGGLYMTGQSFWEFGDPDWDHAKYFMLWGVAEDHASNPIKIGLEKLKRRGAKFVAINPVRTGYQAIADEWIGIRPGTDGLLALSFAHVLLKNDQFDWEFLSRYTNATQLVIDAPGTSQNGLLLRDESEALQVWDQTTDSVASWLESSHDNDVEAALFGEYTTAKGVRVKTVMTLLAEKYLSEEYAPENVAATVGVDAATIERLALEMAHVAFKESITIETPWTDWTGRRHERFIGRPVAMHAMRGISAHSNGFQTCRSIHLLQVLLGAVDSPGSHLAKPPFPKHIAPPIKPAKSMAPDTPLSSPPLGFPMGPEDLVIDANGEPLRIDKAYSWEAPIANHGMMHMVINNAVKGDPYPIDTLILFMANMSWNSSMNTAEVQDMLREKDEYGDYKLPFIVTSDAFHSEMVNYSDLVLPDTTYLERFDTISMLDRPISEAHSACDAIRQPIVALDRDVRPWQEVLVDIGTRLGFPALTNPDGGAKFKDYKDFITNWEKAPGIGFLAGWRGENGDEHMVGAPNPDQWQAYQDNDCFFEHHLPPEQRYYRFANKDYLEWAKSVGFNGHSGPIVMELYSEVVQKFRLAGQGLYDGPLPKHEVDKQRLVQYFDPLPCWYVPLEEQRVDNQKYPFHAVNQRPMFMYHSWDSQNAWLRQIMAQNYLYMNRERGEALGIHDLAWVWVESHHGKIRCQIKLMEGCNPDTVWTWNAIGKQSGAWGLSDDAPESQKAFLMNHLISELLPSKEGERGLTNSDPVTGQAAWYDLKVNVTLAAPGETGSYPTFASIKRLPDMATPATELRYHTHVPVNLERSMEDALTRGPLTRGDKP